MIEELMARWCATICLAFFIPEWLVWLVIIIGTFGAVVAWSFSAAALFYGLLVLVIKSRTFLKKSFFPIANPAPHATPRRMNPEAQTDKER